MNDLMTSVAWVVTAGCAFALGWRLRTIFDMWKREALERAALEESAAEYDRGFEDGYSTGLDVGVKAGTKHSAALQNHQLLSELAARRFAVGGRSGQ